MGGVANARGENGDQVWVRDPLRDRRFPRDEGAASRVVRAVGSSDFHGVVGP